MAPLSIDNLLRVSGQTLQLEARSKILNTKAKHTFLRAIDDVVASADKRDAFHEQLQKLSDYFSIPDDYPPELKEERERHLNFVLQAWKLDNCVLQRLKMDASAACRLLAALEVLIHET